MTLGLSLDHIAITVQDMDRAVAFYRDVLDFEVLGQLVLNDGTFELVYLQAGSGRIELFAFTEEGRGLDPSVRNEDLGFKHVAFQVDDVDTVARRLQDHGVEFTVQPTDAPGDVRLAFFLDPDGNLLEIVDRLPDMAPYRTG
jgi:catechol 2,3-dioxygenase-like lactoylglutathione lyase family enzyme